MAQNTLKTKLGKRLRHLFESIDPNAQTVWDLCCDHGALGRAILESRQDTEVIFNDIRPQIMLRLSNQLKQLSASNYRLITAPAEQLKLVENKRQTVVVAGIGDEQCIKVLNALCNQQNADLCQFIVSPTTKVALVRRHMIDMGLYVLEQSLITENRRTYEVICVSTSNQYGGEKMTCEDDIGSYWSNHSDHIDHLKKLIDYYAGQAKNSDKPYSKYLLNRYTEILKNLLKNP